MNHLDPGIAHGTLTHWWFLILYLIIFPSLLIFNPLNHHHQNDVCLIILVANEKKKSIMKHTQTKQTFKKNDEIKGVDHCASANRVCHARAQCINLQTTYACHCSPGYTGDGKHCSGTYLQHISISHHTGGGFFLNIETCAISKHYVQIDTSFLFGLAAGFIFILKNNNNNTFNVC